MKDDAADKSVADDVPETLQSPEIPGESCCRGLDLNSDDVARRTLQDEVDLDPVLVAVVADGCQGVVEGDGLGNFSVDKALQKRTQSPAVPRDCGHVRAPERREQTRIPTILLASILLATLPSNLLDPVAPSTRPVFRRTANLTETAAFMDGDKRIFVCSMAGGTGRNYHADLSCASGFRLYSMLVDDDSFGLGAVTGRPMLISRELDRRTLVPVFNRQADSTSIMKITRIRACRKDLPCVCANCISLVDPVTVTA